MKTYLITGSNRGIGFAFTHKLLESGNRVFACCRNTQNASDLQDLKKTYNLLDILTLDVSDSSAVENLRLAIANEPIDVLVHNAGVYGVTGESFENVSWENFKEVMHINAFAPLFITQALMKNIEQGSDKLVVGISSSMGSIEENSSGSRYAYRASKAALNMILKSLSIDLIEKSCHVLSLHPGWVQTDMGGPDALITTEESVQGMMHIIQNFREYDSGGFYHAKGHKLPW